MNAVFRPRYRGLLPVYVVVLLPLVAGVALRGEDSAEIRRRLRAAEMEIEKLRGDLHEAHRELAVKAERIENLEREVEGSMGGNGSSPNKVRKPSAKTGRPASVTPGRKPATERKRATPARGREPETMAVHYEAKSAVNYEGRERALAWVKSRLETDPAASFIVTGWANDTKFPETNQEVAENRARYLADFLVLSGIDRERLSCEASRGQREGAEGRQVVIRSSERRN